MTEAGARRLNQDQKDARRRRFLRLWDRFVKERPGESPVKLIARAEGVTIWTVYDVLKGRSWFPPKPPKTSSNLLRRTRIE